MATYATLQADIGNWLHRGDMGTIAPSFISLAEEEIFKTHQNALRVREMETEADLVVTALAAQLPADFLEARYIKLNDSLQTTIYYVPPEKWRPSSHGYFTIVGNEIRLPTGVSNDLKLVYYAKPAALSVTPTNTVLDNYYGAYLKASLKYAFMYTKDTNGAMAAQAELDSYLSTASNKNKSVSAGPLYVVAA
jgi:hypothetical protein